MCIRELAPSCSRGGLRAQRPRSAACCCLAFSEPARIPDSGLRSGTQRFCSHKRCDRRGKASTAHRLRSTGDTTQACHIEHTLGVQWTAPLQRAPALCSTRWVAGRPERPLAVMATCWRAVSRGAPAMGSRPRTMHTMCWLVGAAQPTLACCMLTKQPARLQELPYVGRRQVTAHVRVTRWPWPTRCHEAPPKPPA
jgi:hypothetical protein